MHFCHGSPKIFQSFQVFTGIFVCATSCDAVETIGGQSNHSLQIWKILRQPFSQAWGRSLKNFETRTLTSDLRSFYLLCSLWYFVKNRIFTSGFLNCRDQIPRSACVLAQLSSLLGAVTFIKLYGSNFESSSSLPPLLFLPPPPLPTRTGGFLFRFSPVVPAGLSPLAQVQP